MPLTPRAERHEKLLAAGVPAAFLALLSRLEERDDDLDTLLRDEDDAYYYLGGFDWDAPPADLRNREVTPVYSGGNGDTYILLTSSAEGDARFIYYGLEEGTMCDYGASFQRVIAALVVTLFEWRDDWPIERVAHVADELGLARPLRLLQSLEESPRQTWKERRDWEERVLPKLIDHGADDGRGAEDAS